MFRTAVSALALIAALGACAPNPNTAPLNKQAAAESQEAISARLNAWFDTRYEEQLQFSPIQLTFLGRKDKNDQIDCFTHACADEQLAWLKTATDELKFRDLTKFPPMGICTQPSGWRISSRLNWAASPLSTASIIGFQRSGKRSAPP
jgi:hypothetical protein